MQFVRFLSAEPNARGTRPGIFALANGLARGGVLTREDEAWWRESNAAMNLAYTDPATVDPTLFDRLLHPRVSCWFKETATPLLEVVAGYLALLDRYDVGWQRLCSDNPGHILYEDSDQVVVEPPSTGTLAAAK